MENHLITADASVIERLAIFSEPEILKLSRLITKPDVKIAVIDGVIQKQYPEISVFTVFQYDEADLRNTLFVHYVKKFLGEGNTKAFANETFFYCFQKFMETTTIQSANESTISTMKKLVGLSARFIKNRDKSKEFNALLERFLSGDSKSEPVAGDKSIVAVSQALVDSVKHAFKLTKSSSAIGIIQYVRQQKESGIDITAEEQEVLAGIVSKWISETTVPQFGRKQLYDDKLAVFHILCDSMEAQEHADYLVKNSYYDEDREIHMLLNHEIFSKVIAMKYGADYMEKIEVLEKLLHSDTDMFTKLLGKYLEDSRFNTIQELPNKLAGFFTKSPEEYLNLTGFDASSSSFGQYVRTNKKNAFELGEDCVNKEFFQAYLDFLKKNSLLERYVAGSDRSIPFGLKTLLNKEFTMEVTKFGIDVDRKEGRLIKTAVRLVRMYIGQGFVMCPDADLEKIVVDVISEVVPNGDNDLETLKALVKSQLQQFDSRYGKDKTPVIAAFRSLVLRAIDATDKGKVLNSFGFDDDGKWNFLFK